MGAQAQDRPSLPALWTPTEYQNLGGHPRTAFGSTSPAFSASPMSSRSLPSPMYPSGGGYDTSMRRHERAMVDRLDRRQSVQLAPITEQHTPRTVQIHQDQPGMLSPISQGSPGSPGSPRSGAPIQRRSTIVAETRSILLSGLPPLQSITHTSTLNQPFNPHAHQHHRRRSSSSITTPTTASLSPAHYRRNSFMMRQRLQEWGPVTFGNAKSADVFVAATALRRPSSSGSSTTTTTSSSLTEDKDSVKPEDPSNSAASGDNTSLKPEDPSDSMDTRPDHEAPAKEKDGRMKRDGHVTVRARIRPRELERKAFVIQRNFDLEALRSTVLDPADMPPARRMSEDARARVEEVVRRRSIGGTEAVGRSLMRSTNTMPMHIQYARQYLPVLAALMLSGHVRNQDTIDLPIPHLEAWQSTVAWIYTQQVEITDAIRENILYLGGEGVG